MHISRNARISGSLHNAMAWMPYYNEESEYPLPYRAAHQILLYSMMHPAIIPDPLDDIKIVLILRHYESIGIQKLNKFL